jgi:hypothetical protein
VSLHHASLFLLLGLSSQLQAQSDTRGQLSLLSGPAPYDLSGTGTGLSTRIGLTLDSGIPTLRFEPSLGVLLASGNNLFLPEVSLQAVAGGRFRPYVGVGAGAAWQFDGNGTALRATLHAALGARLPLSDPWGLRAEIRARSVDPWAGETVDLAVGVTRNVF